MVTKKINTPAVTPVLPAKKVIAKKVPADTVESIDDQIASLIAEKEAIKAAEAKKNTKLVIKGKSPKDIATAKGEPYVEIMSIELDPDNIGSGAFELDFNDIFVAKLVRAGYSGKEDVDVVDNWFKTICKNIVTEEFEQWEANQPTEDRPRNRVDRKDLGSGLTEIS